MYKSQLDQQIQEDPLPLLRILNTTPQEIHPPCSRHGNNTLTCRTFKLVNSFYAETPKEETYLQGQSLAEFRNVCEVINNCNFSVISLLNIIHSVLPLPWPE